MKRCNRCNVEKELSEFNKNKYSKDGLMSGCKECIKSYKKKYREEKKEDLSEKKKIWNSQNKNHISEYNKKYKEDNKEHVIEYDRKYKKDNKEDISKKRKEYDKKYFILNKEKNRNKVREYQREYNRKRKLNDPLYKLTKDLRVLICKSISNQGYSKKSKTNEILGCSFEEFKIYIENKFLEGMSWDNRNKWHIDHIFPVSLAKNEEDLYKLNHYTNLQPLWAFDNISKGNRIL